MTISGKPFIELELDFSGKDTVEERQQYMEDCALILAEEFKHEIKARGGNDEYFCTVESSLRFIEITDFELLRMEIKSKAIKFL